MIIDGRYIILNDETGIKCSCCYAPNKVDYIMKIGSFEIPICRDCLYYHYERLSYVLFGDSYGKKENADDTH